MSIELPELELKAYVALAVAAYGREHSYTQVPNFEAHEWVKKAMQLAYESGFNDGYNAGVDGVPI